MYDNNVFKLNLCEAERDSVALYERGRVRRLECLRKGEQVWPINGVYKCIYRALCSQKTEIELLAERLMFELGKENISPSPEAARMSLEALEALVTEGWVSASYDPGLPFLDAGRA